MALNFGIMQPANISGQMLAGQQQAQQNQLAQQQLKQSEMQTQQSTMQMEQMKRDRDALGKLQAQFVANGKSPDLEVNADAMMASGIQHYVDVGMQIKQKLQQQKQFADLIGGGTPAFVAPAMPANALAPPSSESAAPTAPVNALAPMQAAPVDQAALLQQRINQAYALNSPQSLAWAKSMEGLRQQQMTSATAEAGRKVTERGQDIGASTAKAGQESVAATAKAGQGITLRGQNLTNQPPVAVVDPVTGKQVFVSREEALRGRMTPAASLRFDVLKQVPVHAQKAIVGATTAINKIDDAIAALESGTGKEATGMKGYLPDTALNRMYPKGVEARAAVADIGSLVMHERSGAAVTASESPRLKPFIPLITDDKETALKKLKRMRQIQADDAEALAGTYNPEQGFREFKTPVLKGGTPSTDSIDTSNPLLR